MTGFACLRALVIPSEENRGGQGWLNSTTEGGQDKRGSPVVIQAIDMAWFPACLSVVARAAYESLRKEFNAARGTVCLVARLARRP